MYQLTTNIDMTLELGLSSPVEEEIIITEAGDELITEAGEIITEE